MSTSKGLPADRKQVEALLAGHVDEHRGLPESTRLRDLGSEKAVIQDYSGRVVFELLQNALDRATGQILLRWDRDLQVLEVANDGRAITTEQVEGRRPDIQAMLSMHASSKSAGESIGNKGVGFRSVFSAANRVEVWSRAASGEWWGMGLRHPARIDPTPGAWSSPDVASFYSPAILIAGPESGADFVTSIRLQGIHKREVVASIETSMDELARGTMAFLQQRARSGVRITLKISGKADVTHEIGSANYLALAKRKLPVPDEVRASTGLDLASADVWVVAGNDPGASRYWSYLPTEQPAGFGMQIHGDFYLSNSRRHLTIKAVDGSTQSNTPQGWNGALVQLAAECIIELWDTAAVCLTEDFWLSATPNACTCPHLEKAVGILFWENRGSAFSRMVKQSFPEGRTWPVARYRQMFEALEAWARYAYDKLGYRTLTEHREYLVQQIAASGAEVIPIIGEPLADDASVPRARPLAQGQPGQARGADADRIYYRRPGREAQKELAPVIMEQRTFVTSFTPNVQQMSLARQGQIEFERPEILAQLRPAADEHSHGDLIVAALGLAAHEGVGGSGSFLQRAIDRGVGAAWRLVSKDTFASAGHALSNLMVKALDGQWHSAARCARIRGTWPQLDEPWLAQLLEEIEPGRTVDDLCLLLGITPIPLRGVDVIELPDEMSPASMVDLIRHWGRLSGFLAHESGAQLLMSLKQCRWLHSGGQLAILDGFASTGPYAPLDVWRQLVTGGFRTKLLPRLELPRDQPAQWAAQLGIANALEHNGSERVARAFERLRCLQPAVLDASDARDLTELYRNLIDLTVKNGVLNAPLLYRSIGAAGRQDGLAWGQREDLIWHDTGDNPVALMSFSDIKLWVVRKLGTSNAEKLGVINFAPTTDNVSCSGDGSDTHAVILRNAVLRALPDLLAAASAAQDSFDSLDALSKMAQINIRHYADVWIEWSFMGKVGSLGKEASGDVFEFVTQTGSHELWFDGSDIPLVECAYPLSQLLTGKRAAGAIFKDGLHAWSGSLHSGADQQSASTAVLRFRRDHGISDQEVADFKSRLDQSVLSVEERSEWVAALQKTLESCGLKLLVQPFPGMTLRPDAFASGADITRAELETALTAIPKLRPMVDFANTHRAALLAADPMPAMAAAVHSEDASNWTEQLLERLQQQVMQPHPSEVEELQHLRFDPQAVLHRRLNVAVAQIPPPQQALDFAEGKLWMRSRPATQVPIVLRTSSTAVGAIAKADAQDADDFIHEQRRKAAGGRRAEEAVLNACLDEAMRWFQDDPEAFHQALASPLARLGVQAQHRAESLTDRKQMARLLHVASYIGDAGFDVLVPEDGKFLMVEVKRISHPKTGRFFISENERRKALEYRKCGLEWRLWLITHDGHAQDASAILDVFGRHASALTGLAEDGLRPGEWMFVLNC